MKKFLALAVFAVALAAPAAEAASVYVRVGPPPRVRETVVARPGPRHVWVPGYYRYSGARYVWAPGYWAMPPRHRTAWVPGYWAHRPGGYVFIAGYWR
jgi:hypothetical protein